MRRLTYIPDEELYKATKTLVDAALAAKNKFEKDPYRNVIDPFSALFDSASQKISTEEWMSQERARQIQKALQNAIGDFHQTILGAMPGWENAGKGGSYDVKNVEKKVIAEIKNKYNTLNSGGALAVYDKLHKHLDYGADGMAMAYLVDIVPQTPKPYEFPFTPTERGVPRPKRDDIVRIDGQSFYALASGDADALRKLYEALPFVLADVLEISASELMSSPTFDEMFKRVYDILR